MTHLPPTEDWQSDPWAKSICILPRIDQQLTRVCAIPSIAGRPCITGILRNINTWAHASANRFPEINKEPLLPKSSLKSMSVARNWPAADTCATCTVHPLVLFYQFFIRQFSLSLSLSPTLAPFLESFEIWPNISKWKELRPSSFVHANDVYLYIHSSLIHFAASKYKKKGNENQQIKL